jgi:hypothetical protein
MRVRSFLIALIGLAVGIATGSAAATTRITFADFFASENTYQAGIGMEPQLEISPRLESMNGERIEIFGFMDALLPPDGSFFILLREPFLTCPFHANDFDWAGITTVFVDGSTPYIGGPVRVEGRLGVGRDRDGTGLVSYIRIYDARVSRVRT